MFVKKLSPVVLSAVLAASLAGCKAKPNDEALTGALQARLASDSGVPGGAVQATVQGGVATLNGIVDNDAQRELATRDATAIAGVKQVVNNITVQGAQTAMTATPPPPSEVAVAPPPAPVPVVSAKSPAIVKEQPAPRPPAPIERPQPVAEAPPPQPPPPMPKEVAPPQPQFRNITLAAGTTLPIRITQTLDSATTQPGDSFTGAVATDIVADGLVVIPQGTTVTGHVDAVQEAAHFKGSSLLTVSLTTLNRRGEHIALATDPYSVKGKGRGESTAVKTGIGAGAGAILGGILGGGKGAAIGAAAGGGVGAGSSAVTRGQQVQIPSETLVRFSLNTPIIVKVRTDGGREAEGTGGGLQPR